MRDSHARLVPLCLIVAESCWAYAAIAVVGLVFGQTQSPLPWATVLILLAIGGYFGWLCTGLRGDSATLAILLGLAGVMAIYFALAAGSFDARPFDLAWPARLVRGEYDARQAAGAVVALVSSVILWRRAVGIVTDPYIDESLQRSFKAGIVAMAIGVLAEMISGRELGITLLMVLFFGASLAGLAVARLPEHGVGKRTATWARVIASTVVAIVGLGLLLGLIGGLYGSGGVNLLIRGWGLAVDGLLWLIRYPLQLLVSAMFAFWSWIKGLVNPSGETINLDPIVPPQFPVAEPVTSSPGTSVAEQLVHILQYPLLAVVVIGIFLAIALAFRRYLSRRPATADEDRERIEISEAGVGDLLKGLLPSWFRRTRAQLLVWRYPSGEDGVAEVFQLYFDCLAAAIKRGMNFDPAATPSERTADLAAALPGLSVEVITERFNAACYGREPTDQESLHSLRNSLTEALARPARAPTAE